MTIFIVILLALLAFAFIIYPFFRQRSGSAGSARDIKLRELRSQRDALNSILKELEFDFQAGMLSEADYRATEARCREKAASLQMLNDSSKRRKSVDEEIEQKILSMRRKKGLVCPQCGASYHEGYQFCAHCGKRLKKGSAR